VKKLLKIGLHVVQHSVIVGGGAFVPGGVGGLGAALGNTMCFFFHKMIPSSISPSVFSPSPPGISSSIDWHPGVIVDNPTRAWDAGI